MSSGTAGVEGRPSKLSVNGPMTVCRVLNVAARAVVAKAKRDETGAMSLRVGLVGELLFDVMRRGVLSLVPHLLDGRYALLYSSWALLLGICSTPSPSPMLVEYNLDLLGHNHPYIVKIGGQLRLARHQPALPAFGTPFQLSSRETSRGCVNTHMTQLR